MFMNIDNQDKWLEILNELAEYTYNSASLNYACPSDSICNVCPIS